MGNAFPWFSPLPGTHRVVPPLIFRVYTVLSVYNCYFIGRFEMCNCRDSRNKIPSPHWGEGLGEGKRALHFHICLIRDNIMFNR